MKLITNYLTLIRRLRNAEHFDLFENIVEHIRSLTLKPAALVPIWNILSQLFEKEDEIYKRDIKSVETKQINESNEKRKAAFMAFKRHVEAATYDETDAIREAGLALTELTEKYADAYKAPMTEISALIFNMIQDLERPRYAAAVTTLGLAAAKDRMERENEAFKAIYTERTYNLEETKSKGNMKEIRRQVDAAAVNFTDNVNAFHRTNEMTQPVDQEVKTLLEDIITFFNSYIHQYELIYSRRNPKYHPGKDDDDPSFPDDNGDEDEDDDNNEPAGPPRFTATAQTVEGSTNIAPSTGSQMTVAVEETEAFAAALYPVAQGGILRLYDPYDNSPVDYPITGFLPEADSNNVTGLILNSYAAATVGFVKPFTATGNTQAEVIKEEQTLAFIDQMQYPATIAEG
ncbi:MAG: DUF6261 family protein [Tannerellaceae bacterium]|jgi:hypothetical protein|nr:DUF6261 family protein [Tannerellaceae bacterium]